MRSTRGLRTLLAAVLVVAGVCYAAPARAGVAIGPSIVRLMVRAGATQEFEIKVSHDEPQPREFEVEVHNMTASPQGFPTAAPDDYQHGCADWLTVSPTGFSLRSDAMQRVKCRVRVPRGAAGGYYALIMIRCPSPEPRGAGEGAMAGGMRITQILSTGVLLYVPGRDVSLRLRPQAVRLEAVPASASGPGGWVVEALVANEGNTHGTVRGECQVRLATGKLLARTPMEAGSGTILAAASRIFTARGSEHLSDGVYVVKTEFWVPGTRIRAATTEPFAVKEGEGTPVDPTEDLEALITSLMPPVAFSSRELVIPTSPGARTWRAVSLANLSGESLSLSVASCEWQLSPQGEDEFPETAPQHNRSAQDWLTVTPETVTIKARGRATLRIRAAVPRESRGEYFACVRVRRTDAPGADFYSSFLPVRISTTRTSGAACEISEFAIEKVNTREASVTAVITNTGPCVIWPTATVEISDSDDKLVLRSAPLAHGNSMVLPGQQRRFTLPLDLLLRPEQHSATLIVTPRENEPAVSEEASFEAPPWTAQEPATNE